MYFHLTRKQHAPMELVIWELVEATGWTLEYIDSLPLARLHEYLQIQDGRVKAAEKERTRGRKIT